MKNIEIINKIPKETKLVEGYMLILDEELDEYVEDKNISKKDLGNNIYSNVIQANNSQKGDINLDGKINENDIQLLEKHLIDIEKISKDKQENADIYEDNTINLVDLHYLIKNINNKTDKEEIFIMKKRSLAVLMAGVMAASMMTRR